MVNHLQGLSICISLHSNHPGMEIDLWWMSQWCSQNENTCSPMEEQKGSFVRQRLLSPANCQCLWRSLIILVSLFTSEQDGLSVAWFCKKVFGYKRQRNQEKLGGSQWQSLVNHMGHICYVFISFSIRHRLSGIVTSIDIFFLLSIWNHTTENPLFFRKKTMESWKRKLIKYHFNTALLWLL